MRINPPEFQIGLQIIFSTADSNETAISAQFLRHTITNRYEHRITPVQPAVDCYLCTLMLNRNA